jgi:hypothetical protein
LLSFVKRSARLPGYGAPDVEAGALEQGIAGARAEGQEMLAKSERVVWPWMSKARLNQRADPALGLPAPLPLVAAVEWPSFFGQG